MSNNNAAKIERKTVNEMTIDDVKGNNTSQKIRYLDSLGYKVGEIEKILDKIGVKTKAGDHIRYQFVRNVVMMKMADDK